MEGQQTPIIERLEEHKESIKQNIKYSIDRFDILIISLSSGGLVLSTSFAKDFSANFCCPNFLMLKLGWALFALALVLNLISQVTSYIANNTELLIVEDLIREKKGKVKKSNQTVLEKKKVRFNSATNWLNIICLFTFVFGVIVVIIFMYKTI